MAQALDADVEQRIVDRLAPHLKNAETVPDHAPSLELELDLQLIVARLKDELPKLRQSRSLTSRPNVMPSGSAEGESPAVDQRVYDRSD